MFRRIFGTTFSAILILTLLLPSEAVFASQTAAVTATVTAGRSLTITSPNGGEVMSVASTHRITWNASPNIDKVSIGYKSCVSCLNWIVTNIPNTGFYDWN